MKKIRKVLVVLLVVTMITNLAGCKPKETEQTNTQTTVAPTEAATTAEATPTEAPVQGPVNPTDKYEPIDMGGRTFTISYNYDIRDTGVGAPDPATASDEEIAKYANLERIEKKYNCKIDFINTPDDQTAELMSTSVLAGKPWADAANMGPNFIFSGVVNNLLMKVSEFAPANADILNDNAVLYSPGKIMGDDYVMVEKNVPVSGRFVAVNNEIVSTLGMETPQELYKKGEWTWENFEKIAVAATKDTDGDGVVDQWGYSGVPQLFLTQIVASNDGYLLDDVNAKQGFDNPNTMEAFEFMNKIYNVDKVAYVNNNDIWDWGGNADYYKQGKSAMFYAETWMFPDGGDGLFDYSIVPFPTGPKNTTGSNFSSSVVGLVIPRGVENPEWVYIILEELADWYGADYSVKEQGTMDWLATKYLTEEDVQTCVDVSGNMIMDNSTVIPDFPVGGILQGILLDGKTVAQSVEATKQIAQDKIDAFYKQ